MRLIRCSGEVILRDPDVEGFGSQTGSTCGKAIPRQYRTLLHCAQAARSTHASGVPDHRPAAAGTRKGRRASTLFLQATQDITVGGRSSRGSFQYTLQT